MCVSVYDYFGGILGIVSYVKYSYRVHIDMIQEVIGVHSNNLRKVYARD